MSLENRQPPSEGGEQTDRPAEAHVSFVQRLQRHFGPEVDPEINLQSEEEGTLPGGEQAPRSPSTPSTQVVELVRRLEASVELGSRYEIKGEVARGGMGSILRIWDADLRRNLAMKVMHGRGSGPREGQEGSDPRAVDPERLGRFLEEAQITGQLDHPGVVPVHDLGIDSNGRCYFTMRFVRGRELKEVLDLARRSEEGWTRTKVLGVILKVCEAMAYAHSKGVVHRDLKPANVMVGRFGETYVMDWGLARVLGQRDSHDLRLKPQPQDASALSLVRTARNDESSSNPDSPLVTMDGDVIGTPSYMAPEQARGRLEEVGPRSDVYSLGAILYYMLTGQTPYVRPGERVSPHTVLSRVLDGPPQSIEGLAPHEPPELVAICVKAMARDPEARYASMLEVADDIQAFLENRVVRAYERGSVAEFRKWVARNRGMAAGIAGMVTLSIASALGFAWQKQGQIEDLARKEADAAQARDVAKLNEALAKEKEQEARNSLVLAEERRKEADHQTEVALANEEIARRSGYVANVLAAQFSLELDDLVEARERLSESDRDLRGWEWRHLDLKANQAALAKLGHFPPGIEAVAFHPRFDRAVLLNGQGRVFVKDLKTQEYVAPENIQLVGSSVDRVRSLFSTLAMDVSPDGSRLAVLGLDSGVYLFDLETGKTPPGVESAGLHGHQARTSAVAFSSNGRYLASGDAEGGVLIWDAVTSELVRRVGGHLSGITDLAWSPGSERLASSSRDGTLRVWDFAGGQELQVLRGHRGPVTAARWDLSGQHLFSSGEDGAINMWEVETGHLLRNFTGHQGAILALDYDPNHGRLVSGSADTTVRVWDVASRHVAILRGHEGPVQDVAFSPEGDRVLSGENGGTVYLWDAEGDLAVSELVYHRAAVNSLAFDPTGKQLVTASSDHELVLWDAETGEPLRRLRGHRDAVRTVCFAPDGKTLLSSSMDRSARLWDAQNGRLLRIYSGFDKWLEAATFTPDGQRVLVGSGDRKVYVLDAETTEVLQELSGQRYAVHDLRVSPDGRLLAILSRDVILRDLEADPSAEPRVVLRGRNTSLAFSPDSARLATGTGGGLVQLWDAAGETWIGSQQNHKKEVSALTFSPDGQRLASASEDGKVHVRDGLTGETLLALEAGGSGVLCLAFSPDGSRLAAGLENGKVLIWETTPAGERRERRIQALELREQALSRVDELFARLFLVERVVLELQADLDMPRPLKEAALRLAHLRGDDPGPLFQRSLQDCLEVDNGAAVFRQALERAEAAERMKVEGDSDGSWELRALSSLTMGVATYRAGRYGEAESYLSLDQAQELPSPTRRVDFGPREQALRQLFLCMAQCQTVHVAEANRSWRQAMQSISSDAELSQNPTVQNLVAEMETLVRTLGSPTGS